VHRFQATIVVLFVVAVVGCGVLLIRQAGGPSRPTHVAWTQDGIELTLKVPRRAPLHGELPFTAVVTNRSPRTVAVSGTSWWVLTDAGPRARRGAIKYAAPGTDAGPHVTLGSGESTTYAGRLDLSSIRPLSRRHPAVYPSRLTLWAGFGGLRDSGAESRRLGVGSGDRVVSLD
jgi:hypothetical protein